MDLDKLRHAHDFVFQSSIGDLKVGPFTMRMRRTLLNGSPTGKTQLRLSTCASYRLRSVAGQATRATLSQGTPE